MPIKLKPDPTFKADVEIMLPGGKTDKVTFEFLHMDKGSFEKWREERNLATKPSDAQAIMRIAKSWSGIEGDPEFNEENLTALLDNYHDAGRAIGRTFVNELLQVRLGN